MNDIQKHSYKILLGAIEQGIKLMGIANIPSNVRDLWLQYIKTVMKIVGSTFEQTYYTAFLQFLIATANKQQNARQDITDTTKYLLQVAKILK